MKRSKVKNTSRNPRSSSPSSKAVSRHSTSALANISVSSRLLSSASSTQSDTKQTVRRRDIVSEHALKSTLLNKSQSSVQSRRVVGHRFATTDPAQELRTASTTKFKSSPFFYRHVKKEHADSIIMDDTTPAHAHKDEINKYVNATVLNIEDPVLRETVRRAEHKAVLSEQEKDAKLREYLLSSMTSNEKIKQLIDDGASNRVILNAMYNLLPRVMPTRKLRHNIDRLDWMGGVRHRWAHEIEPTGYDVEDSSDYDNLPQQRPFSKDEMNRLLQDVEESKFIESDVEEALFAPAATIADLRREVQQREIAEQLKYVIKNVSRETPSPDRLDYRSMRTEFKVLLGAPRPTTPFEKMSREELAQAYRDQDRSVTKESLEGTPNLLSESLHDELLSYQQVRRNKLGLPFLTGPNTGQVNPEDLLLTNTLTNAGLGLMPPVFDITELPLYRKEASDEEGSHKDPRDPFDDAYSPFQTRFDIAAAVVLNKIMGPTGTDIPCYPVDELGADATKVKNLSSHLLVAGDGAGEAQTAETGETGDAAVAGKDFIALGKQLPLVVGEGEPIGNVHRISPMEYEIIKEGDENYAGVLETGSNYRKGTQITVLSTQQPVNMGAEESIHGDAPKLPIAVRYTTDKTEVSLDPNVTTNLSSHDVEKQLINYEDEFLPQIQHDRRMATLTKSLLTEVQHAPNRERAENDFGATSQKYVVPDGIALPPDLNIAESGVMTEYENEKGLGSDSDYPTTPSYETDEEGILGKGKAGDIHNPEARARHDALSRREALDDAKKQLKELINDPSHQVDEVHFTPITKQSIEEIRQAYETMEPDESFVPMHFTERAERIGIRLTDFPSSFNRLIQRLFDGDLDKHLSDAVRARTREEQLQALAPYLEHWNRAMRGYQVDDPQLEDQEELLSTLEKILEQRQANKRTLSDEERELAEMDSETLKKNIHRVRKLVADYYDEQQNPSETIEIVGSDDDEEAGPLQPKRNRSGNTTDDEFRDVWTPEDAEKSANFRQRFRALEIPDVDGKPLDEQETILNEYTEKINALEAEKAEFREDLEKRLKAAQDEFIGKLSDGEDRSILRNAIPEFTEDDEGLIREHKQRNWDPPFRTPDHRYRDVMDLQGEGDEIARLRAKLSKGIWDPEHPENLDTRVEWLNEPNYDLDTPYSPRTINRALDHWISSDPFLSYFDSVPKGIKRAEVIRSAFSLIPPEKIDDAIHSRRGDDEASTGRKYNDIRYISGISKRNLRKYREGLEMYSGVPPHILDFLELALTPHERYLALNSPEEIHLRDMLTEERVAQPSQPVIKPRPEASDVDVPMISTPITIGGQSVDSRAQHVQSHYNRVYGTSRYERVQRFKKDLNSPLVEENIDSETELSSEEERVRQAMFEKARTDILAFKEDSDFLSEDYHADNLKYEYADEIEAYKLRRARALKAASQKGRVGAGPEDGDAFLDGSEFDDDAEKDLSVFKFTEEEIKAAGDASLGRIEDKSEYIGLRDRLRAALYDDDENIFENINVSVSAPADVDQVKMAQDASKKAIKEYLRETLDIDDSDDDTIHNEKKILPILNGEEPEYSATETESELETVDADGRPRPPADSELVAHFRDKIDSLPLQERLNHILDLLEERKNRQVRTIRREELLGSVYGTQRQLLRRMCDELQINQRSERTAFRRIFSLDPLYCRKLVERHLLYNTDRRLIDDDPNYRPTINWQRELNYIEMVMIGTTTRFNARTGGVFPGTPNSANRDKNVFSPPPLVAGEFAPLFIDNNMISSGDEFVHNSTRLYGHGGAEFVASNVLEHETMSARLTPQRDFEDGDPVVREVTHSRPYVSEHDYRMAKQQILDEFSQYEFTSEAETDSLPASMAQLQLDHGSNIALATAVKKHRKEMDDRRAEVEKDAPLLDGIYEPDADYQATYMFRETSTAPYAAMKRRLQKFLNTSKEAEYLTKPEPEKLYIRYRTFLKRYPNAEKKLKKDQIIGFLSENPDFCSPQKELAKSSTPSNWDGFEIIPDDADAQEEVIKEIDSKLRKVPIYHPMRYLYSSQSVKKDTSPLTKVEDFELAPLEGLANYIADLPTASDIEAENASSKATGSGDVVNTNAKGLGKGRVSASSSTVGADGANGDDDVPIVRASDVVDRLIKSVINPTKGDGQKAEVVLSEGEAAFLREHEEFVEIRKKLKEHPTIKRLEASTGESLITLDDDDITTVRDHVFDLVTEEDLDRLGKVLDEYEKSRAPRIISQQDGFVIDATLDDDAGDPNDVIEYIEHQDLLHHGLRPELYRSSLTRKSIAQFQQFYRDALDATSFSYIKGHEDLGQGVRMSDVYGSNDYISSFLVYHSIRRMANSHTEGGPENVSQMMRGSDLKFEDLIENASLKGLYEYVSEIQQHDLENSNNDDGTSKSLQYLRFIVKHSKDYAEVMRGIASQRNKDLYGKDIDESTFDAQYDESPEGQEAKLEKFYEGAFKGDDTNVGVASALHDTIKRTHHLGSTLTVEELDDILQVMDRQNPIIRTLMHNLLRTHINANPLTSIPELHIKGTNDGIGMHTAHRLRNDQIMNPQDYEDAPLAIMEQISTDLLDLSKRYPMKLKGETTAEGSADEVGTSAISRDTLNTFNNIIIEYSLHNARAYPKPTLREVKVDESAGINTEKLAVGTLERYNPEEVARGDDVIPYPIFNKVMSLPEAERRLFFDYMNYIESHGHEIAAAQFTRQLNKDLSHTKELPDDTPGVGPAIKVREIHNNNTPFDTHVVGPAGYVRATDDFRAMQMALQDAREFGIIGNVNGRTWSPAKVSDPTLKSDTEAPAYNFRHFDSDDTFLDNDERTLTKKFYPTSRMKQVAISANEEDGDTDYYDRLANKPVKDDRPEDLDVTRRFANPQTFFSDPLNPRQVRIMKSIYEERRIRAFLDGSMNPFDASVMYQNFRMADRMFDLDTIEDQDRDLARLHREMVVGVVREILDDADIDLNHLERDAYNVEPEFNPEHRHYDHLNVFAARRFSPYNTLPMSESNIPPIIGIEQQRNIYNLHLLDPVTFHPRWLARRLNIPYSYMVAILKTYDMTHKVNMKNMLMPKGDENGVIDGDLEGIDNAAINPPFDKVDVHLPNPPEIQLGHLDQEYLFSRFAPNLIGRVSWSKRPERTRDFGMRHNISQSFSIYGSGSARQMYETERDLVRRFQSHEQVLDAIEQASFARFGPITYETTRAGELHRPPKLPREIISTTVHPPSRHNWALTTTDEKKRGIFGIQIRDRDGYLRHPTYREFRNIRNRERDRRIPFFLRKYHVVGKLPDISNMFIDQVTQIKSDFDRRTNLATDMRTTYDLEHQRLEKITPVGLTDADEEESGIDFNHIDGRFTPSIYAAQELIRYQENADIIARRRRARELGDDIRTEDDSEFDEKAYYDSALDKYRVQKIATDDTTSSESEDYSEMQKAMRKSIKSQSAKKPEQEQTSRSKASDSELQFSELDVSSGGESQTSASEEDDDMSRKPAYGRGAKTVPAAVDGADGGESDYADALEGVDLSEYSESDLRALKIPFKPRDQRTHIRRIFEQNPPFSDHEGAGAHDNDMMSRMQALQQKGRHGRNQKRSVMPSSKDEREEYADDKYEALVDAARYLAQQTEIAAEDKELPLDLQGTILARPIKLNKRGEPYHSELAEFAFGNEPYPPLPRQEGEPFNRGVQAIIPDEKDRTYLFSFNPVGTRGGRLSHNPQDLLDASHFMRKTPLPISDNEMSDFFRDAGDYLVRQTAADISGQDPEDTRRADLVDGVYNPDITPEEYQAQGITSIITRDNLKERVILEALSQQDSQKH